MATGSGVQYAIDIAARMTGGAITIAELDSLARQLTAADVSAGALDQALVTTTNALAAARTATASANSAVGEAERSYSALERAALKAAQVAERAAASKMPRGEVLGLEVAAIQAAQALEGEATALDQLRAAASAAAAEQAALETTQRNLARLGAPLNSALRESARAAEQQGKAFDATQRAMRQAQSAAGSSTPIYGRLAEATSALGGPFATLSSSVLRPIKGLADLSAMFGTTMAVAAAFVVGTVAVVAALGALAIALGSAAAAATAYGVSMADARRSSELTLEALAASDAGFASLGAAMRNAADATGLADDRLIALAKQLRAAKVSSDDMPAALQAVATAERALGQGGADKFIERIRTGRTSVAALADEVQDKFGNVVQRQMLSLDTQSATLQRNLGRLFGGLNIEELLPGLAMLVRLFDENTAAGRTMKDAFEGLFQPLVDAVAAATYVIEAFVLGFLIGGVRLYIALKPVFDAIAEWFGFEGLDVDPLQVALAAGEIAAYMCGIAIAALAAGLGVLAALLVGMATPWAVFAGLVAGAGFIVYRTISDAIAWTRLLGAVWDASMRAIGAAVLAAFEFFSSGRAATVASGFIQGLAAGLLGPLGLVSAALSGGLAGALATAQQAVGSAVQLGADLVRGVVQGVSSGASAVADAMRNMATNALNAAKQALGIASPSREAAKLAAFTGEGFVNETERQAPAVQAAMSDMFAPPPAPDFAPPSPSAEQLRSPLQRMAVSVQATSAAPSQAPRGSGGSGPRPPSGPHTFNFYGVKGVAEAKEDFADFVTRLLEGDAVQAGGAG